MKILLTCLALLIAQMNTLQDKKVVHLQQPHLENIQSSFGGKLLELINAPKLLNLPAIPPKPDSEGNPWSVDVKNLGPIAVTVVGKAHFSVQISVNQTVHIYSNGTEYSRKW